MTAEPFHAHPNVLTDVWQGMTVYDREGDKIGTVRSVYLGATYGGTAAPGTAPAEAPPPDNYRDDSLVGAIAEVFAPASSLPEEMRKRLVRTGFVKIDSSGLFASDLFATPDEIAQVGQDSLTLNAVKDELLKE